MNAIGPQVRVPEGDDKEVYLRLVRQELGMLKPRNRFRGALLFSETQIAYAEHKAGLRVAAGDDGF